MEHQYFGKGLKSYLALKASTAIHTTVPALVAELIAALQEAEADRFPQSLRQPRFSPAQALLPARQSHLLALLQVRFTVRRLVGKWTGQKNQWLANL